MKSGKYDCVVRFLSPTAPWVFVKRINATMRYGCILHLPTLVVITHRRTNLISASGFIAAPDLRPADVFTPALGNAYTALDISMCSPYAQQAGPDCTQSRLAAKNDHCGHTFPSLLRQNISNTRSFGARIHRAQTQFRLCRGRVPEAALQRHLRNVETERSAEPLLLALRGHTYVSGPRPNVSPPGSLSLAPPESLPCCRYSSRSVLSPWCAPMFARSRFAWSGSLAAHVSL